jgi:hypothetical protein
MRSDRAQERTALALRARRIAARSIGRRADVVSVLG